MTVFPFPGLSGEGTALIATGTFVAITDTLVLVTAWPPTIRVVGAVTPRGLWNVGWVGLGQSATPSPNGVAFVTASYFIRFENFDFLTENSGVAPPFFDSLFWRFKPGVTADVTLFS